MKYQLYDGMIGGYGTTGGGGGNQYRPSYGIALCNLPHICAPAGISELCDNMHETVIPEISEIPFVFVRGVKSVSDNLSETDMMRGEETEICGLMGEDDGKCMYILPGSHSLCTVYRLFQ